MKIINLKQSKEGFILPAIIAFMVVIGIISVVAIEVISTNTGIIGNGIKSQEAFNIAEAGINYYLWHLSHNPNDFKDG